MILHRLRVAGFSGDTNPFSPDAVFELHKFSKGRLGALPAKWLITRCLFPSRKRPGSSTVISCQVF